MATKKVGKSAARKAAAKKSPTRKTPEKTAKSAARKVSSQRELIAPRGDKRYIRRDEKGRIKESDDQGRSLSRDITKVAEKKVPAGQGDRGDQARRK